MRLRLSRPAARQLDGILTHIAEQHPQGAQHVRERLQAMMDLLLQHPFAGHATTRRGIRRIVASPYPYAITYSVGVGEIVILGVRHTARRPSP
ncbi:MAG TPA: type II toxin-antitoxin system RelE/ParE family toxin [Methylorubrum populi]|uniref:Type II toxin-antitoxin system RelE/ParE family toxin n=1 Tax=Methylorubrum populi TaxID=223967 RepID=A0A921E4V0_9HYPH|nr:type II toxin-antitoxin system RelE/ParE family toxin [Methylorubrum populi]